MPIMSTLRAPAASDAGTQQSMLIEKTWQLIMSHFSKGVTEIALPMDLKELLRDDGVNAIAKRFRYLKKSSKFV